MAHKVFIINDIKVIRKKTTIKALGFTKGTNLYSCKGCDALNHSIVCKPNICFVGWTHKYSYILKRIN